MVLALFPYHPECIFLSKNRRSSGHAFASAIEHFLQMQEVILPDSEFPMTALKKHIEKDLHYLSPSRDVLFTQPPARATKLLVPTPQGRRLAISIFL